MEHPIYEANSDHLPSLREADVARRRFPKSSIKILKAWFLANAHDPHPTDEQKRLLCQQTGLSIRQVSNWFANARRRGVHRPAPPVETYITSASEAISVPNPEQPTNWASMNPLERWRNSPPDQEAASLAAIADAVADGAHVATLSDPVFRVGTPFMGSSTPKPLSETSFESMSSFWTSGSSSSAHSERSDVLPGITSRSLENLNLVSRRRRRKSTSRYHVSARRSQKATQPRLYKCTFCTDAFKTKFDWVRHEGTLHLVLEKWTCTPEGPTYLDSIEQVSRCALCDEADPDDAHLLTHNYRDCSVRSIKDRTFRRKDHLKQHLRLIHSINTLPLTMSRWRSTMTNIESRCGFCGEQFTLWSCRMDHIGDHFQEGTKMTDWKGDRGLNPAIASIVENAMPPYMIGLEAETLVPFSATRNLQSANSERDGRGLTERTMFQDFTVQLAESVLESLRNGILVTDETVRRQARLLMFGDDDAWNQTPADNAEWLRSFKNGLNPDRFKSTNQLEKSAELESSKAAYSHNVPANLWAELAEASSSSYFTTQNADTRVKIPKLPLAYPANGLDDQSIDTTGMFHPLDHFANTTDMQKNHRFDSTLDIDTYLHSLNEDHTLEFNAIGNLPSQDLVGMSRQHSDVTPPDSTNPQIAFDVGSNTLPTPGHGPGFPDDLDFFFDLGIEDNSQSYNDDQPHTSSGAR